MSDSNHSIVVPIDTGKDEIQEWAMLELNGELLPPKESNPVQLGSPGKENPEQDCLLHPGTVELGSLRFDNGVSHFTVRNSWGYDGLLPVTLILLSLR